MSTETAVEDMHEDDLDPGDLLMTAWGIIANAGEGDWDRETQEWQEAAVRWRERFHAYLDRSRVTA